MRDHPDRRDIGCRQDQHEFIPAEARQQVVVADRALQALGGLDQDTVADIVAEIVVDLLEAVEIDIEQREGLACPLVPTEGVGQVGVELEAIGEPGQLVEARHLLDPRLGRLPLRRILGQHQHAAFGRGGDGDDEHPAVARLQLVDGRLLRRPDAVERRLDVAHLLRRHHLPLDQETGDRADRRARQRQRLGNPVESGMRRVRDRKIELAVEHRQAMDHRVESGVERQVLRAQGSRQRLGLLGRVAQRQQIAVQRVGDRDIGADIEEGEIADILVVRVLRLDQADRHRDAEGQELDGDEFRPSGIARDIAGSERDRRGYRGDVSGGIVGPGQRRIAAEAQDRTEHGRAEEILPVPAPGLGQRILGVVEPAIADHRDDPHDDDQRDAQRQRHEPLGPGRDPAQEWRQNPRNAAGNDRARRGEQRGDEQAIIDKIDRAPAVMVGRLLRDRLVCAGVAQPVRHSRHPLLPFDGLRRGG